MPETMPRSLRIPTDLWQEALVKAQEEGVTLTAIVIKALERYVKR